jgi:hypothetical protein
MNPMIPAAVAAALVLPGVAVAADTNTVPAALRADLAGHATVGEHMRAYKQTRKLRRVNLRLARRVAQLEGERVKPARRARIARLSAPALRKRNAAMRERIAALLRAAEREKAAAAASAAPAPAATPAHLAAIAACESGGNPAAIGGGGMYRGKYQFSMATWQSVGGSGDPAAASEAEQDMRAAMLYAQVGSSAWPVCG